jgi:hypothetical protein
MVLCACLVVYVLSPFWKPHYNALFNAQARNLLAVERHIKAIRPSWQKLKSTTRGFDCVHLFAYTGSNGVLGAYGVVPSSQHLARVRAFLESTKPPTGLYLAPVRVGDEDDYRYTRSRELSEQRQAD